MKIKKNKIVFRCDNHKYVEYTLSNFFHDTVSIVINHRMEFYIDINDFVPYTIGHWRDGCGLSEDELDFWYQWIKRFSIEFHQRMFCLLNGI